MTDALKQYLTAKLGGNADGPTDDDPFWQHWFVLQTIETIERQIETLRERWQQPTVTVIAEPTSDSHQLEPIATVVPPEPPIDPNAETSLPEAVLLSNPSPTDMPRFGADQPASPTPLPIKVLVLPNATVGKPYSYVVDFAALGLPELASHSIDGVDSVGLVYTSEKQQLSGTPIQAGEFTLTLTYRLKTDEANRPALSRPVQLLINADPRSLWKNLPSDTTDPYFKPDAAHELQHIGNVRLLAASVRGRSHAHEGIFRDDDFGMAPVGETGWFLLTVADGAGSAKYSRKGAQLACQTLTQAIQALALTDAWATFDAATADVPGVDVPVDEPVVLSKSVHDQLYAVLGKGVFAAYKAIEAEASTNGATLRDYATTLLTTLAKPYAGGWLVGAFMVGDGGIGIYRAGHAPVLLGTPDGGEFAGQTRFLTMSDTFEAKTLFSRFRFVWVPTLTALVLMTDGVTDPKFQTDANLNRADIWDNLWADLTQSVSFADDTSAPVQLQDWLNFWSPGNHDDRTIALLYDHA